MKIVLHTSESRGAANHGWLQARHTFSFANYYCPDRVHFGALRVLNDDIVQPGMGFGTHPHDNMEIITLVLEGALEHKDSMGNGSVIRPGEVQVMSAGTGVYHSEFNPSETEQVNLFQIWVFPDKKNVEPRYDQTRFDENGLHNQWKVVVSPKGEDQSLWIHQNAWFSRGNFDAGLTAGYTLKTEGQGIYLMVIDGEVKLGDQVLRKRDGAAISGLEGLLNIEIVQDARLLLMEIPMN